MNRPSARSYLIGLPDPHRPPYCPRSLNPSRCAPHQKTPSLACCWPARCLVGSSSGPWRHNPFPCRSMPGDLKLFLTRRQHESGRCRLRGRASHSRLCTAAMPRAKPSREERPGPDHPDRPGTWLVPLLPANTSCSMTSPCTSDRVAVTYHLGTNRVQRTFSPGRSLLRSGYQ